MLQKEHNSHISTLNVNIRIKFGDQAQSLEK